MHTSQAVQAAAAVKAAEAATAAEAVKVAPPKMTAEAAAQVWDMGVSECLKV